MSALKKLLDYCEKNNFAVSGSTLNTNETSIGIEYTLKVCKSDKNKYEVTSKVDYDDAANTILNLLLV